ncbi:MAG: cbb3-type cytochrome c oxidase subunit I [Saprospiraceae bacterium]|nr:cbb3-type cytochrome c oxidase subunit I [Saprospiraceae bacterium]
MLGATSNIRPTKPTNSAIVIPFYLYAAFSFLVATILLLTLDRTFFDHHFQPHTLAIIHIVALGWATMIILGACHHLTPTILGNQLYSEKLAWASFICMAVGVPLLAYGFYVFNMGHPAKWGGRFVLISVLLFLINLSKSLPKGHKENIHGVFMLTSGTWLFLAGFLGLMLVYNFTFHLLPHDSIYYLPLHVHAATLGWFLMLIVGVSSRLIPMYLLSKYQNDRLLKVVYYLINGAIIFYVAIFYLYNHILLIFIPVAMVITALILYVKYCYMAWTQRMKKQVDEHLKISLFSVGLTLLPAVLLILILLFLLWYDKTSTALILTYGFLIFFGWITAIILGMTFKTLPFIVPRKKPVLKAPQPGQSPVLLTRKTDIFKMMSWSYLSGITIFSTGILTTELILIKLGAVFLLLTAIIYNWKVIYYISGQPPAT